MQERYYEDGDVAKVGFLTVICVKDNDRDRCSRCCFGEIRNDACFGGLILTWVYATFRIERTTIASVGKFLKMRETAANLVCSTTLPLRITGACELKNISTTATYIN